MNFDEFIIWQQGSGSWEKSKPNVGNRLDTESTIGDSKVVFGNAFFFFVIFPTNFLLQN